MLNSCKAETVGSGKSMTDWQILMWAIIWFFVGGFCGFLIGFFYEDDDL